jgi:hypothetical protein
LAGTINWSQWSSISIGWYHQIGRNGVFNIHWLTPPSWSQWNFNIHWLAPPPWSQWEKNGTYFRFQE